MSTKQILEAARERISDEANWCVGTVENSQGQNCAMGAISKVAADDARAYALQIRSAWEALAAVLPTSQNDKWPAMKISTFNNTKGHACTLAAFDAAIASVS